MNLSIFTENDQVMAKKEIDSYGYNQKLAIENIAQSEFKKAAKYLMNAASSLETLEDYKNNKLAVDQAVELLNQIRNEERKRGWGTF